MKNISNLLSLKVLGKPKYTCSRSYNIYISLSGLKIEEHFAGRNNNSPQHEHDEAVYSPCVQNQCPSGSHGRSLHLPAWPSVNRQRATP